MTPAQYRWKLIRPVVRWLAIVYATLLIGACTMVNRALYHPEYGSRRAPAGLQKIKAGDGTEIAVLHLPNPKAQYTIWFFHGNAEDLGDLEPFLVALRDNGFAVFAFDYPGYGLSGGVPSEEALYAAARVARQHLRTTLGVSPEKTMIYGRSLGSGPATQMATEESTGGLILQAPFMSVYRVVTRWRILPFDQFENVKKISKVGSPVLVMHGTADEVIPFRHGEAMLAAAAEPKRSLWVPGAGHNNFIEVAGPRYWGALREFAEMGAKAQPRK
jgi:hypothetical protein